MKQYFLNEEVSLELFKQHEDIIEPKNCYINIFKLLTVYPQTFRSEEWKIAYGYISSVDNVYCRHCFIFAGDEVIDPTIFSTERYNSGRVYYITKVFNSIDGYLSALDAEKNYPALQRYLQKEDSAACEWAQKNGYLFIG